MNATPHTVHAKTSNGVVIEYPPSPCGPIRCNQTLGSTQESLDDCPVVKAGIYTIDTASISPYKDAKILIVSTIVANAAEDIRKNLGTDIRILVPDSGPSAKRDEKGQIEYVTRFLEY